MDMLDNTSLMMTVNNAKKIPKIKLEILTKLIMFTLMLSGFNLDSCTKKSKFVHSKQDINAAEIVGEVSCLRYQNLKNDQMEREVVE